MKHFVALLVLSLASSAYALDCKNALSTPEMNECAARELRQVETRLNKAYRAALARIATPDTPADIQVEMKKSLVAAQRAWVTFRENECHYVYLANIGGTIRTLEHIGCMRTHAIRRIEELGG